MPVVRVSLASGRTSEQKKAVALEITESIARHCNVHKEHIYVIFEDLSADDWTVGGETIAERRAKRGED